ncbi:MULTISPECIES: 2,3-diaminopropionate biosynthesis protein SbnA [Rhodomicrobium]|uniref:2,3-diaminopropionate biosynthesis protein SbnA n=1 Tax=Rhodomicrobium TaxID=1068 RepID=UPI000B4BE60E|nr:MULTISPECIES: 2,3-diaminopropionate biosynthesis protein SbnA [Rhodomicrobium]
MTANAPAFSRACELFNDDVFVPLEGILPQPVFVKIEALNTAGSVKIKTALNLINTMEKEGQILPDSRIIESSSGNLGVALSMICAGRGYDFTCVVDPNASARNIKIMEALGTHIVTVTEPDENGGYLGTRIRYIKRLLGEDPRVVWTNQYANPANAEAHRQWTATAIDQRFPRLDYLFIGAGTTGTLMGCVRHFRAHRPEVKIVAVDVAGSVTFGCKPGKRHIPGLGASRRPELFDPAGLFAMEMIDERDTIGMCRHLAQRHGFLAGGSTGTVLAAVLAWKPRLGKEAVIGAISPDLGERYLDTIYNDDWVKARFGEVPRLGFSPATAA